jgi:uncharacterized protein
MQIDHKWDHVQSLLRGMRLAVIAYSGGVDSSLLLRAASDILGPNLIAVTADSETYPSSELDHARSFARSLGVRHRVISTRELDREAFVRNDPDRCYHCKRELFSALRRIAESEGIPHVLDGTNADDLLDHRPGRKAAEELSVRSPLAEAGFGKQEVRHMARKLGMPMWDKPSLACLSSRIPYGTKITHDLLRTVLAAEEVVQQFGIRQVRVRHHGDTARIEVDPAEFGRIISVETAQRLVASVKGLGYTYVCLDLEGYRTGSMNAALEMRSASADCEASGDLPRHHRQKHSGSRVRTGEGAQRS